MVKEGLNLFFGEVAEPSCGFFGFGDFEDGVVRDPFPLFDGDGKEVGEAG